MIDDADAHELATMLLATIKQHTFAFADEEELQRGLAAILPEGSTRREVQLTPQDRIDFLVGGVGIEVKVKGSISALTRQLYRYAQLDEIEALIVVTPVARLTRLPTELGGKPLHVCHLLGSCL